MSGRSRGGTGRRSGAAVRTRYNSAGTATCPNGGAPSVAGHTPRYTEDGRGPRKVQPSARTITASGSIARNVSVSSR